MPLLGSHKTIKMLFIPLTFLGVGGGGGGYICFGRVRTVCTISTACKVFSSFYFIEDMTLFPHLLRLSASYIAPPSI